MAIPILAAGARAAAGAAIRGSASKGAASAVGSMNINVTSNVSAVAKAIDAFGKNQIPFATHRALNDTAFAVRKEIVERTYPQSFIVKNRSFARAMFRVQRSPNKRTLTAAVFDQLGREYMVDQAEGGFKVPRGRSIAIPAQDRPAVRGRASYDRHKPRTVLGRPRAFVQRVGDQEMILERRTKNRYPLKRLYLLEQRTLRIPKRFPFYEQGGRTAQREFEKAFRIRYRQALRTARR
jgi:hypothetical protein